MTKPLKVLTKRRRSRRRRRGGDGARDGSDLMGVMECFSPTRKNRQKGGRKSLLEPCPLPRKMALQRGEGLEDGAPMRNPNIDYALGLR